MSYQIDNIGDPETDRFWVQIEKEGGNWRYTIRTKSDWCSVSCGAEVARLNPYHVAQQGGEEYVRALLNRLNRDWESHK
jgi:hypothetical protein